ncbi:MAG TPA: hypothetical protein VFB15_02370 [Candidatus Binataceae bacterium]|nr:hypothetical protein [Candidatus Binataceae bacterium]
MAALLLVFALSPLRGYAGDLSGQSNTAADVTTASNNGISVSGAGTSLLPQTQAADQSLLSGLHVSGYGNQLFGMWQNSTGLREYTHSRNSLATSRSLLQVDENWRLNENNTFFGREWFVYEPPYSYNSANNPFYGAPNHASYGSMMNDYYNNYQIRDFWWQNKLGPLTTFVGNQIVVWGQSVAFRVGDVINPADTCWAFGFANLEQSRNAQWMLHPILNLPEWGPFTSNFIEAVIEPGFSPVWWPEQTGDPYHKYREMITAGRVQPCFPAASHGPSARFDVQYTSQPVFGLTAPLITPGAGGPNFNGNLASGFANVNQPAAREFMTCSQLAPLVQFPYNFFLRPGNAGFIKPCRLGFNKHNNPISPIGDATLTDTGFWHVPGMQPQNWNDGVRLHTLVGSTEITALYYNDNVSGGVPWSLKWTPYTNLWNYSFYDIQEMGVTADRPLPIPASWGEYFPAVGRGEAVYLNHVSVGTMQPGYLTTQRYSDEIKYMLAVDVDQAYAPWLTQTGNLTSFFEVMSTIYPDTCRLCGVGNDLSSNLLHTDVDALMSVSTSWLWSDIVPTWAMIFNPKGRALAMFPTLALNPPWTKKYFMQLGAIEVLSGDKMQNFGLFKGQNQLTAQFQYNFDLM